MPKKSHICFHKFLQNNGNITRIVNAVHCSYCWVTELIFSLNISSNFKIVGTYIWCLTESITVVNIELSWGVRKLSWNNWTYYEGVRASTIWPCHFLEWHTTKTTSSLNNSARQGNLRSLQVQLQLQSQSCAKHKTPADLLECFASFCPLKLIFRSSILHSSVWLLNIWLALQKTEKDWWCWSCLCF